MEHIDFDRPAEVLWGSQGEGRSFATTREAIVFVMRDLPPDVRTSVRLITGSDTLNFYEIEMVYRKGGSA